MIRLRPNLDGSRTAEAACVLCRVAFDSITQTQNVSDGTWSPSVEKAFAASGWLERGGNAYCGRFCLDRHGAATQDQPGRSSDIRQPVDVTRPILPSPQRRPAVPPQHPKR